MKQLTSTARKIDLVFRILIVALAIVTAAALAGLVFVGAGMIFHLPIEDVPKLDQSFAYGLFTFYTEFDCLAFSDLFPSMALVLVAAIAMLVPTWLAMKTIRDILKPMTEGQPFHRAVSQNLSKLAWLSLITGALYQLLQAAKMLLGKVLYGVDLRLFGQTVFVQLAPDFERFRDLNLRATPSFNLSFLVLTAVLFLLAYVFRYGEELQTLSDETV